MDTGYIIDKTLKGGKLGFYVFSQPEVVWKNVSYKCNGKQLLFMACGIALLFVLLHFSLLLFSTLSLLWLATKICKKHKMK